MIDTEVARLFDRRSAIFLTAGAVLTSVLVMRMLQMQVFNYSDYKRKSENNSFRIQMEMPERGKILSQSGMPISRDTQIYRIYIIPEEVEDLDSLMSLLMDELKLQQKQVDKIYARIKKQAKFQPVLISENSNWKKLAELQAKNLPGLHIKSGFTRIYELGAAGAQIFGYTGIPDKTVSNIPFFTTGISGLERSFNEFLAGKAGQTVMITNAIGRVTGEDKSQFIPAEIGGDLKITIREDIQKKLHDSLTLNRSGCGVVMDIKSGNVLAMTSAPSFDPNNFRLDDGEEYIASLRTDFAKPFMNKALEGLYPPGSTFKIVVALAALESGAVTPTEKIHCPGHWDYGDRRYHCWEHRGHGNVDLIGALKHSCDIYFYQIALRIGIDAIRAMAVKLGLGEKFMDGVLPREMAGVIPDRKWKERHNGARWLHGDTIISGIGQGFILTNCLQLATMTARAVSNSAVTPRLINDENDKKAGDFPSLHLQSRNIKSLLNGLEQVMQRGGTAAGGAINIRGQKMGGKTGTSQVRSISRAERDTGVLTNEQLKWNMRNHGLFVGYAPTSNPKYVVCVITEHSGGSSPAVQVAAATMTELLQNG